MGSKKLVAVRRNHGPGSPHASNIAAKQKTNGSELHALEARNYELERKLNHYSEALSGYVDQYDFAPIGFVTLTARGCIQEINITGARMLGKKREGLIDLPFLPFVTKADFKVFLDHMRQSVRSGKRVSTELRLRSREPVVYVELVSVPVLDTRRQTIVYRTAIVDISRRKLVEMALGENEKGYRDLVELSPDAIWVHSDGWFILANPAAIELFDAKTDGDLVGHNMLDFIHTSAIPAMQARLRKFDQGGLSLPRREELHMVLNHKTIDVDLSACAFAYKGKPATLMIARDVTLRKRAESLIREAEERFSKAFLASPTPTSITTLGEERFIDVNNAFLRLHGCTRREVIGHRVADLGVYSHIEDHESIIRKLRDGMPVSNVETRLRTKSGQIVSVVESLELIDLGGKPCILTLMEDVTDRRRLEKEILDISEREQSRVGQDLHDSVCQDLVGIAFLAQGLAKNLTAKKLDRAKVSRDADEIAKLIKRTLDDAHGLATGLYPVRVEDNGLMSALAELASDTSKLHKVGCHFKCDIPVPIRDNNVATHLFRIVQEAVSNALKHGRPKSVVVQLARAGDGVTLTIQDDGSGFRNVPHKNSRRPGMGLKTMGYRAQMIGGALEIAPRHPCGTTVMVRFKDNIKTI
ncbi:MAG: PAS domain S-box protein [Chthoniobacteraceae bacterium]